MLLLPGPELDAAVQLGLKAVKLWTVADKPCGSYSGGMRRRLSVAISLMGDPRVVYLDEPSTVSRHSGLVGSGRWGQVCLIGSPAYTSTPSTVREDSGAGWGDGGGGSTGHSGGNRWRLSVVISLMGDPRMVYLDEPSTVRGGQWREGSKG